MAPVRGNAAIGLNRRSPNGRQQVRVSGNAQGRFIVNVSDADRARLEAIVADRNSRKSMSGGRGEAC